MAIQLGSAYGKIALDVAGLLSGVKKGKEGLLTLATVGQQVGDRMKKVGAAMTIGLTLPIVAMGAASIKAASDFEETKNKAVVVFAEMADSVVQNANKSATALGISKTQYLDYASSIGAALTAGGMGIKESTELAEGAVKHFADVASFHNARVEDVAVAWQSAIRGQYEPIQRYFPFITNEYLKTYGIANGMLEANTKNLTANQRALILNAIALNEELNPALDDFAETSGGLANQSRILKAQWQDALVMLGQNLLPVALKVVAALNQMLEAFNKMSPGQQKVLLGFLGLLALAGPLISLLGTVVSVASGIAGLPAVLGGLGISLGAVSATVTGVAVPAVVALGAALLPILAVLAAVILFVGIFALAWKSNFLFVRDAAHATTTFIKNAWKALVAALIGENDLAKEYMKEAWDAIGEHINNVFEKVFGVRDAWARFLEFLNDALRKVVTYISNVFTKTDWSQLGKQITWGLANGVLLGIPTLVAAALKAAEAALATIKKKLGISSPSKAFEQLGMFSAQGYQLGLAKAMSADAIARTMSRPVQNLSNSQQQVFNMQFASGLTMRDVQGMISQNNEDLISQLNRRLGGE